MEEGPSWEASSSSAIGEIPRVVWYRRVYYHVYKNQQLVPILSQVSPVSARPSYLFRTHFNVGFHLRPGLPSALFIFTILK